MPDIARFTVFMAAAFVLFVGVLLLVLRRRKVKPSVPSILLLTAIVVIVGMLFARYSHIAMPALSWTIYYGVPALITFALPPAWLRMSWREAAEYVPLALVTAPVIHLIFSLFVGWHDYMPFPVRIPAVWEM